MSDIEQLVSGNKNSVISDEMTLLIKIIHHIPVIEASYATMIVAYSGICSDNDVLALSNAIEGIDMNWRLANFMDLFTTVLMGQQGLAAEEPVVALGIGRCDGGNGVSLYPHILLDKSGKFLHIWWAIPSKCKMLLILEK